MNFRHFFSIYIIGLSVLCACRSISALTNIPLNPIIDEQESHNVDYSFLNDPYLLEQQNQQPLIDITQANTEPEATSETPIVDPTEAYDVDFSFFNDPYAFEKFNDLPIKAKVGGYLQYSSWWDSRQNLTLGEGYVLLFPLRKEFDVNCKDINARGEYNSGVLETRLRGEFFGPKVLGAESFGYLETDFFGNDVVAIRMRIRHAFMKLTWNPSEILLGQFWHPAFNVKCYPLTLNFGAGAPNAAISRNPQITYTYRKNNKELLLSAAAQVDFTNTGPIGPSSTYLRNSRVPMLCARFAYDSKQVYAGTCIGFERLKPRLESNKRFRVNESINSAFALVFAKLIFNDLEIRQNFIYAQNANNMLLLGGFGVNSVNPATDERHYTNTSSLSYWMDINLTQKVEPGLFIGIAKNLGAQKKVLQCIKNPSTNDEEKTIYGLGLDINTLIRIAPRIRWHVLPVDFAAELEYCRAAYGCLNNKAQVKNTDPVFNVRLIFTTYYYF